MAPGRSVHANWNLLHRHEFTPAEDHWADDAVVGNIAASHFPGCHPC